MSENIPTPSSDVAVSKASPSKARKDEAQNYNVSSIMSFAAKEVRRVAPGLNITLPRSLTNLPKLMSEILPVLSSDAIVSDSSIYVPSNPSAETRARLRRMAQDTRAEMLGLGHGNAPQVTRPIFTSQNLSATDLPKPLTREQRQRLKDQYADMLNETDLPSPHFMLPVVVEDRRLPTVEANITIRAVDAEDDGPQQNILRSDCLWDTGSHFTIISDDCLSRQMRKDLQEDPGNEPYVQTTDGPGGPVMKMKVQVSAVINMSNLLFQLDTIAVVLPRNAIPNNRSGIIIGQKGTIDKITYISKPRSIMEAEGRDPGEQYWGVFNVVQFINADQDLVNV